MFASIRRYRLMGGSMQELIRRVDDDFAEEIKMQPGFISYELIDCGDGELMTVSMFAEADQAEASRELAQQWTDEHLQDLEFRRIEALRGQVMVSRAADEMLEPAHAQTAGKFASVRRYRLRSGAVAELMHIVDEVFTHRIESIDGFEAYHALECGHGEIVSISLFRDPLGAQESDDESLQFVREHLGGFDIERSEVTGGEVHVSRAVVEVLAPAHA